MRELGFAMFDTAIGRCAIAWSKRGVLAVQLPERNDRQTRARLIERFPHAREALPPDAVEQAIAGIAALLRGEPVDLRAVALDMEEVAPFPRRVYETARKIPAGATLSYGEIAAQLGAARATRAVGQALGRNPLPILVPCHRVLAAGGRPGGFSANGGVTTKLRLLAIESVHAKSADAPAP
jgi:methylated-DNA-[protein]-cysteine S-methyltransferase